jgi:hypothetical protein
MMALFTDGSRHLFDMLNSFFYFVKFVVESLVLDFPKNIEDEKSPVVPFGGRYPIVLLPKFFQKLTKNGFYRFSIQSNIILRAILCAFF